LWKNEHRQHHPFKIGDEVFLDTRLLLVGYADVNKVMQATTNSRKFQHPYAGPFRLLKKAGENAFLLDIPAHWRLHPVFNVARLKLSKDDRTRSHPTPPPLRSTAASAPEYEVEATMDHRGSVVRNLKYLVKWRYGSQLGSRWRTLKVAVMSFCTTTMSSIAYAPTSGWTRDDRADGDKGEFVLFCFVLFCATEQVFFFRRIGLVFLSGEWL